jgi:hypothetical protein
MRWRYLLSPFLIKRSIKHWWQRRTRGWDNSDTWSLDYTIAKFVLPRLKKFEEVTCGVPGCLQDKGETLEEREKVWHNMLKDMIFAMEMVIEDGDECVMMDDPRWERYEKGMDYFHEYFRALWW